MIFLIQKHRNWTKTYYYRSFWCKNQELNETSLLQKIWVLLNKVFDHHFLLIILTILRFLCNIEIKTKRDITAFAKYIYNKPENIQLSIKELNTKKGGPTSTFISTEITLFLQCIKKNSNFNLFLVKWDNDEDIHINRYWFANDE